jgi:hypothetical protein
MRILTILSFFWASPCLALTLMNLVLVPAPDLSGAPGATLTWQLSIENDDPIRYLQLDGFTALASLDLGQGSEDPAAFSFPVVAPSTVETDGFYSIAWLPGATPGYATSGNFQIQSSFCDDNASTNCLANPDVLLPYSAAVGDPVPEPSTAWLLGALIVFFSCRKMRAASTFRRGC